MKLKKKFASIIVVGSLLASIPFNAFAKVPERKQIDYVALGDSLAAGKQPFDGSEKDGYPDYLLERFEQSQYKVGFNNYSESGYTTADILGELSDPKIKESIQKAELVTIDIGANDLIYTLYGVGVSNGGADNRSINNILIAINLSKNNPEIAAMLLNKINETGNRLSLILKNIDSPDAKKVYVMGYYNPFPHLPEEQQAALLPLLNYLNGVIKSAATANGDVYVPTDKIIEKHDQEYLPNPIDIHLSQEGYEIVAKEFWKAIMEN